MGTTVTATATTRETDVHAPSNVTYETRAPRGTVTIATPKQPTKRD